MVNTNLYNKGYQDGFNQGTNNLPKDYRGMITWKTLFFGNHSMDTYTQGFDIGYLDGLRQRNNVNQNNNNSNTTTSITRGINGQVTLLEQMVTFLGSTQEQLNDIVKTQKNFLNSLDNEGIDINILHQLEEYLSKNKAKIENLIPKH